MSLDAAFATFKAWWETIDFVVNAISAEPIKNLAASGIGRIHYILKVE